MASESMSSGVTPPAQQRSQETLDRIVQATERLLDGRAFSEISVLEICTEAEVSVSSFYARFSSKEVLLELLHERHLDERRERFDFAAQQLSGLDLTIEEVVTLGIGVYIDTCRDEAPLVQTYRQVEVDRPALADRRRVLDRYATRLVADHLSSGFGADRHLAYRRIEFATRSVAAAIQDAVLEPFAFAEDLVFDREATVRESVRMWMAYVFSPPLDGINPE